MPDIVASRRPLGRTGIEVGPLSFGSAPLASVFWGNDEETAVATARRAVEVGVGLFDTAPLYGLGESETRLGRALEGISHVAVATKVGRSLVDGDAEFDFSGASVRRQLASSLERLGRDRVEVVHVHDPDDHLREALDECVPALAAMKAEGTVGAVSLGTTRCSTALHFLRHADVDAVMLAGRLTLLDQSAVEEVVPTCARLSVPLLAAGVFNSGVLARPHDGSWYDYAPADDETMARVRSLQGRCEAVGVSLRAAAMAFPLRFDPVASIVVGMASPNEVDENVALLEAGIPEDVWAERLDESA
jgi:D-threo-aldose 1-dehydrogenase